ncbi:MAG: DUF542 domain-containing protein [Chitinophagaceae bacterium]
MKALQPTLAGIEISANSTVSEIVREHYQAAAIFQKYNIEYCCGGRWPLDMVCMMKGIEFGQLKKELQDVTRVTTLSLYSLYHNWTVDFLTDYIINVHHAYLRHTLASTGEMLRQFADKHQKKYPEMQQVTGLFEQLSSDLLTHLRHEEEVVFPYICQVMHAHENSDSYAALLVKTLRKPLDKMIQQEHEFLETPLLKIRELTHNYAQPENVCISHLVALSRLKELDNDLLQHIYLENHVLFPKAILVEKELLGR